MHVSICVTGTRTIIIRTYARIRPRTGVTFAFEMATRKTDVFYAFFECECKGIKFYDLEDVGLTFWQHVWFEREPWNPHDCNAVAVWAKREAKRSDRTAGKYKLGHVAKGPAEWLSLLLTQPFRIYGYVLHAFPVYKR